MLLDTLEVAEEKKPSYEVVARWVLESFNAVSIETVVNGFEKALLDELSKIFMSLWISDNDC